MIDFRYHLVSIIAVFLALAVGLLVGATYRSGPAETLLQQQQKNATTQNNTLRAKNAQLAGQIGADQAFAQAGAARLLTGLLAGEKVVVVEAPGATSQMAGGVVAALQQAGATVTDQVLLQSGFLATTGAGESSLSDLARQLAGQAGVTLPATALYPGTAGQQDAAAVIAATIVSKDRRRPAGQYRSGDPVAVRRTGFPAVQEAGDGRRRPRWQCCSRRPERSRSRSARDSPRSRRS